MPEITAKEVMAALQVIKAVADTIKEMGTIPSGHVYAAFMSAGISLEAYESIINRLVQEGFVRRDPHHLLTWVGPL
jgi:hypothetical protein